MNSKLLLLLLLLPFSFHAQVKKVKATIVNPGSLYSTYDFTADAGLLKPAIKLQELAQYVIFVAFIVYLCL